MKFPHFVALMALCAALTAAAGKLAADEQGVRCDTVMRAQLAKPYPSSGCWHYEDFALAAYWLNQRTTEADKAILTEREKEFPASLKDGAFHWHAYILERIYFLFSRSSKHFPGRMSAEAEAALLDMLWQWAGPRCRLEMTLPARDWWTWGSENHHAQAWAGFWGAAQIFAQHSGYKDRRYADGATPEKMAAAFNDYFKRFARERAAKGLLVECNSGYNKYTLGGWYNMADFSDDPVLRRRMAMLLDLFWADWAAEQINGVRGGSRHRCYPGDTSTAGSGMDGQAWFHFSLGPARSHHPSHICGATTFWRPSPVVMDIANDVAGRGVYEYVSRRPGLAQPRKENEMLPNYVSDPAHPFFSPQGVYQLRPEGGALLRYTYGTPDFVMGTSMVEARPKEDWTNISSQNRWEGVIFAGHPTARIFAQSLTPERGSVYNANWSVQKRGVLIVQRLKASNAKGQRVWFDASLRRVERDGWIFAEAPQAFAAVRVVNGPTAWEPDTEEQHHSKKGSTDLGLWLKCQDEFSPVIIEVARKSDCASFAEFQRATLMNSLRWEKARLDYTSQLSKTTLTLFADYSRPPLVDGQPVNYAPPRVFDSSFIQSDFGSGVVTIQKGTQKLILDFNSLRI
ncbi:MAG: hypothetical protein NTX50_28755 [Candidatus Sumerlaeota bacterium]|nr:hypothetical protein [Candidatus Sumerlaeota bacterium]